MNAAAPSLAGKAQEPHGSVRVLLVEDDDDDRVLVSAMLREAGGETILTSCDRIEAALEPLAREDADLVLLDLRLPDATGLDGLRRLRAAAPEVPVVVLTGLADEELAVEAVQAGAQDYLIKGRVDAAGLARSMRYALERQRAERQLTRMALRDPLTGLPNRVLFADRLEQAVARHARDPQGLVLALMFIDLNGFKLVNDRFGHLSGDQLLVEVGRRLQEELRSADTVARLGGDEFTVLCEGVASVPAVTALAQRLSDTLSRPYEVPGGVARISAAIGVALARSRGEDSSELLRRADAAMYAAKRSGGKPWALADGDGDG